MLMMFCALDTRFTSDYKCICIAVQGYIKQTAGQK